MSDDPDYVADAVARDQRFAVLQEAIAVDADLRDNPTIRSLLNAFRVDGERAMEELADTSPENKVSMADILVRIRAHVYIRRTLAAVLRRGAVAEQAILAEDQQRQEGE